MILLEALELYTHLRGIPYTKEALIAGLPLSEIPQDRELFERAATRVGLSIKFERRQPKELSHFSLPCIALLHDNQCALITKATEQYITLIYINDKDNPAHMTIDEFTNIYSGEVIFLNHTLKPPSDYFSVFGWFFKVLKKHKKLYIQAGIAGGLVNLFLVITTFYALTVYDRVIPHQGFETLWVLTLGILTIYIFDGILKIIRAHFIDHASKKTDIQIGSELFEKMINVRMESRPPSSTAMAYHLKEFESLRDFLSSTTLVTLSDLPFIVFLLLVIGLIGGWMVLIPIIAIVLILVVSIIAQPSLASYVQRLNQVSENKYSVLINSIANVETIKAFNMHRKTQTQWENVLADSSEVSNQLKGFNHITVSITSFIQNISYIATIVTGVYLISGGHLTFGGLIACSILVSRSVAPISQVVGLISRANQSLSSVRELSHIMNLPQERQSEISYQHRPDFQGSIEFINVDFSYPGQRLKSIKNFNIKIPAGSRIGIIGRIGSGKTTLEKLILGLYQPNYGHILIDGVESAQTDPFELRGHIGYIPQDVTLWRGTLKSNIMAGLLKVDDEQFLKACEIAGVVDFARLHPLGFNMPIGEDGSGLSQGQKQAVAIARALVLNPRILLMDEPTAFMDPQSERLFLERLATYLTNQTFIVITHRMPILNLVDRLVVVEQGQAMIDGPRDQVLQTLNQTSTPQRPDMAASSLSRPTMEKQT